MAGLYLDTSAPVAADTIDASNSISTAVAHAAHIVPVGLAALNEDKTPDGVKTVSGSYYIALPHGHTRLPQIPFQ